MNYFRSTEEFHIDFMVGRIVEFCLFSCFWQSYGLSNITSANTDNLVHCIL